MSSGSSGAIWPPGLDPAWLRQPYHTNRRGIGMLAIGAGGLDVAVAMAGGPIISPCPKCAGYGLKEASALGICQDVILKILSILSVKGGVGKVIEYAGPGLASLTVPERATITNMGAELGATTSIFPSDENTRAFLRAQGREDMWIPLEADPDASYEEELLLDLSEIEPMWQSSHSPDNVESVRKQKCKGGIR